jgi:hypothetical protein
LGHWLLRSALIMPGLVIGGVRDKRIIPASLASSTMVSLFLMLYTVVERGRKGDFAARRRPGRRARSALRSRGTQHMLQAEQRFHGRRTRATQRARSVAY